MFSFLPISYISLIANTHWFGTIFAGGGDFVCNRFKNTFNLLISRNIYSVAAYFFTNYLKKECL